MQPSALGVTDRSTVKNAAARWVAAEDESIKASAEYARQRTGLTDATAAFFRQQSTLIAEKYASNADTAFSLDALFPEDIRNLKEKCAAAEQEAVARLQVADDLLTGLQTSLHALRPGALPRVPAALVEESQALGSSVAAVSARVAELQQQLEAERRAHEATQGELTRALASRAPARRSPAIRDASAAASSSAVGTAAAGAHAAIETAVAAAAAATPAAAVTTAAAIIQSIVPKPVNPVLPGRAMLRMRNEGLIERGVMDGEPSWLCGTHGQQPEQRREPDRDTSSEETEDSADADSPFDRDQDPAIVDDFIFKSSTHQLLPIADAPSDLPTPPPPAKKRKSEDGQRKLGLTAAQASAAVFGRPNPAETERAHSDGSEGHYGCSCGMWFTTSQKKAAHCRSCEPYKAANKPNQV